MFIGREIEGVGSQIIEIRTQPYYIFIIFLYIIANFSNHHNNYLAIK